MRHVIYSRIPRLDPALIAAARGLRVADLHEALGPVIGRQRLMNPAMRPIRPGLRICGQAVTCYNYPGDNLMLHAAVRTAEAGDVIVATNGGSAQGALWGDMITFYAKLIGLGGAVVDGAVRDTSSVGELEFPVFSTAISVSHPEKRGPGSANVPMVVAGVQVHPGDLILGDDDGVLAIPRDMVAPAIARAHARAALEETMREKLRAGASTFDLMELGPVLTAAGIEEIDGIWEDGQ